MRFLKKLLLLVLAAAVLAGVIWGGIWFFQKNYFRVEQRILWRHSRSVDLHGYDLEQLDFLHEFSRLETIDARGCALSEERYLWLREEFPQCAVACRVGRTQKRPGSHKRRTGSEFFSGIGGWRRGESNPCPGHC